MHVHARWNWTVKMLHESVVTTQGHKGTVRVSLCKYLYSVIELRVTSCCQHSLHIYSHSNLKRMQISWVRASFCCGNNSLVASATRPFLSVKGVACETSTTSPPCILAFQLPYICVQQGEGLLHLRSYYLYITHFPCRLG